MFKRTLFPMLFLFLLTSIAFPSEKVFSVTVKRVMGEHESRDDIREFATLEAKRMALEKAGTYIETETVVREFNLERDEIIAVTAGVIFTEQTDEQWSMEAESIIVHLAYKITIDSEDLNQKIKALLKNQQKLEDIKELRSENERLQAEVEELRRQLAEAKADQLSELKAKRQELSRDIYYAKYRSPSEINTVVKTKLKSFSQIFEKYKKKDPTLNGRINVNYTILANGAVDRIIIKSEWSNPQTGSAIDNEMHKEISALQFKSIDKGEITVEFPITFY